MSLPTQIEVVDLRKRSSINRIRMHRAAPSKRLLRMMASRLEGKMRLHSLYGRPGAIWYTKASMARKNCIPRQAHYWIIRMKQNLVRHAEMIVASTHRTSYEESSISSWRLLRRVRFWLRTTEDGQTQRKHWCSLLHIMGLPKMKWHKNICGRSHRPDMSWHEFGWVKSIEGTLMSLRCCVNFASTMPLLTSNLPGQAQHMSPWCLHMSTAKLQTTPQAST